MLLLLLIAGVLMHCSNIAAAGGLRTVTAAAAVMTIKRSCVVARGVGN